jgi:hypothetical protein
LSLTGLTRQSSKPPALIELRIGHQGIPAVAGMTGV